MFFKRTPISFTILLICTNLFNQISPNNDCRNSSQFVWYPEWTKGMVIPLQYYNIWVQSDASLEFYHELYKERNPNNLQPRNTIPKKIHVIWVGPNEIPPFFVRCQQTWQKDFPEYEYILWTNKKIATEILPLFTEDHLKIFFNGNSDHREKADVLRLYILREYGGMYIDGDMACLKPALLKEMLAYYDFIIGLSGIQNAELFNNAIIASTANHPIINYLISKLTNYEVEDWRKRSGVYFFSNALREILPHAPGVNIAFPTSVFYAIPYKYEPPAEQYLKPWSLTGHYWANSSNQKWE